MFEEILFISPLEIILLTVSTRLAKLLENLTLDRGTNEQSESVKASFHPSLICNRFLCGLYTTTGASEMNVASLELCKELYELSGWTTDTYYWLQGSMPDLAEQEHYPTVVFHNDSLAEYPYAYERQCPAYDLGYLLRKLPNSDKQGIYAWPSIAKNILDASAFWECDTGEYYTETARSMEDAACKLAIELFKQGVLG